MIESRPPRLGTGLPSGAGLLSVSDGEYETPLTLNARLAADAAAARSAMGTDAAGTPRPAQPHGDEHASDGTDPIPNAVPGGTAGLMSGADKTKLDALSGTNTGDQTITLSGDITGSGTAAITATIPNDTVTYAKLQNVSATNKVLGRASSGAGDVEEIDLTAAGRALIDDADAAAQRTTLGLGNSATCNVGTTPGTVAAADDSRLSLRQIPVGAYSTVDATQSTMVCGGATIDPVDYTVSGRTTVYTLSVIGSVVSGQTLTVVLYDLTAVSIAATLTWTETSATKKTASVTAPGSAHIYELRMSCSGSTSAHYGVTHASNIRITWS